MGRHSFIQMAKLHDVSGRIDYIENDNKQEHLYATYATEPDRGFWYELAACSREEFRKSGTTGKCIEARELVIALPENFIRYDHDRLLKLMTDAFSKKYGVECSAALHHNKRKTNLHIHLVFAERRKLEHPSVKTASRNMFYDEHGKHVRTKKEILDGNGKIRKGCRIIKNGDIYERQTFTIKDARFKQEAFLDEIKKFYTDRINSLTIDEKDKQDIFDKNGPYLATKKIGKNNPKTKQIRADNEIRMEWNQCVDRALAGGVSMDAVLQIKKKLIIDMVQKSVIKTGKKPESLEKIVRNASGVLEQLIARVNQTAQAEKEKPGQQMEERKDKDNVKHPDIKKGIPPQPELPARVSKLPRLQGVYRRLQSQNGAISAKGQERDRLKAELAECRGIFHTGRRKELEAQIQEVESQISHMKKVCTVLARENGFNNVEALEKEYQESEKEYGAYKLALAKWEKAYGQKAVDMMSIKEQLKNNQQKINSKKHLVRQKEKSTRNVR